MQSGVLKPEEILNPKPETRFGVDDETYMMSMLSKGVSEISTAETGSKSGQEKSGALKPEIVYGRA